MEKTVMIIIAVVAVLIIIGVIVALKNKSSADGADTGPQAHVDSASDSAQQAADVSAAAASAAANAATPQEAAAATQQAVEAGAVAQQAAASSAQTAQQVSSAAPVANVDCVLNDWGAYGPCITDSTGQSFKTRLRTIKVQPSGNGKACDTLVDKSTCVPDVDCVLNSWGAYGPCIADSTGQSFTTRLRTIKVQPSGNGRACDTLVDKSVCETPTADGNDPCAGFLSTTAPSATNPIPLACHQVLWKKYCSKPLDEKDWAANYRTFPSSTMKWLDDDAKVRSTHPTWKSHCNPITTSTTAAPSTPAQSATTSGSSDPCAGYTAGSAAKPIPLACHQAIWKTKCSKPLVESDWAPNYRTLPVVTVDWLKQDAAARSTSPIWSSHCNPTTASINCSGDARFWKPECL